MFDVTLLDYDDPFVPAEICWPDVRFYDKQEEIVYAVRDCPEVVVPAGNMLGKDFIAGYLATSFFLFPQVYFDPEYVRQIESQRSPTNINPHTVRVVTTSVKDDHLRVLWGEIGRFIETSVVPLTYDKGGPLIFNHRDIRKQVDGNICQISYLRGMVSESGEGMAGHHAAYTFFIGDEASGLANQVYTQADTWTKKKLLIGNCNEGCENFFKEFVEMGDVLA